MLVQEGHEHDAGRSNKFKKDISLIARRGRQAGWARVAHDAGDKDELT